MNMKRTDYLSWENTFILMSEFIALKSKMSDKKGACIVNEDNLILSLGYSGLPRGIEYENLKFDSEFYEVSAINNAILSSRRNLENTILYTTHFPNEYDTKYLIQNGIKSIYYINEIDETTKSISLKMLESAKVAINKTNKIYFTTDLPINPTFEDLFVGLSNIVSFRSKDPNSQVGACIVDNKNRIISLGYNGFPFGCSDDNFPWGREGEHQNTKYPYVVHAEENAIAIAQKTSPINLEGSKIFTNLLPCNLCATKIIQSGIKEVYYVKDKYPEDPIFASSRDMLEEKQAQNMMQLIIRKDIKVTLVK